MRWALPALSLLLLAGCSSGPAFDVSRDATTVDPGSFEEINLDMKQGDTFDYSWTSTASLSFDIHSHQGNDVVEWVKQSGTTGGGTFKADYAGGFSLLWENNGSKHVSLTYHAHGDGKILG